jgi:hypothetical protein
MLQQVNCHVSNSDLGCCHILIFFYVATCELICYKILFVMLQGTSYDVTVNDLVVSFFPLPIILQFFFEDVADLIYECYDVIF